MSYAIKKGTATRPLMFLMIADNDHVSPVTGITPTVLLSKNGAAFVSPQGAVSELGHGWYAVAPNASDVDTFGPLLLNATAPGADPSDNFFEVVAYDPNDSVSFGLGKLQTIGSAGISILSPVATTGTITLSAGDDYAPEESRNIDFTNSAGTWADLTGATVSLFVYSRNFRELFEVVGTIITPTGPNQLLRFTLTKALTSTLTRGEINDSYKLKATLSNSHVVTLATGKVIVI